MQSRRGFLTTLCGTAASVATGGLDKLAHALAKPTPAELSKRIQAELAKMLDHGYFIAPYIPLQATVTIMPKAPAEFIVIDLIVKDPAKTDG